MKKSKNTKENEATAKHVCEFCGKEFVRETSIINHMCKYKDRWRNKDLQGNRIGFQSWMQFYKKNFSNKKEITYEEFIKSPYYTAFVKFGTYCADINAINIPRFSDWLIKGQIRIDTWCTDSIYTKYLVEHLRVEDPFDAIHRSVETTIKMGEEAGILPKDVLRYANRNKICYAITTGKISPWMLYQSDSGINFLDDLQEDHVKMVIDYINPELWKIKFNREPENVRAIKEILTLGGY